MSEHRLCTVYIPSRRRYTSAKRHDVTGARAPVLLLSAMFGMYRYAHRSPGAGDVMLLLWITSGQELVSFFLKNQNGGRLSTRSTS